MHIEARMAKEKQSKRRKSCTAAEVIVSSVDLLTEILLLLPARSLIRFKCVSKQWFSLISDSQFACNHTRRNPSSLISGLIFHKPWSTREHVKSLSLSGLPNLPTLAFLDDVRAGSVVEINHSCKGLMLCSINGSRKRFIVCNLSTQKYTLLPEHGGIGPLYCMFGACLAFDPSKSHHYKVVLVCHSYDCQSYYQIDIYSSESASWKRMRVTAPRGNPFRPKVFWNGAIHWMTDKNFHFGFDVDAEKLTGTPIPPRPKILVGYKIRYFGECGGHLFLIRTRLPSSKGFNILEMDRDYPRWIVKYRVNLRPIISVFPEMVLHTTRRNKFPPFSVLCVVKGANEKDFALILAIPGKILSYNQKRKALKVLRDFPPGDFHRTTAFDDASVNEFIESLSPV